MINVVNKKESAITFYIGLRQTIFYEIFPLLGSSDFDPDPTFLPIHSRTESSIIKIVSLPWIRQSVSTTLLPNIQVYRPIAFHGDFCSNVFLSVNKSKIFGRSEYPCISVGDL